MKVLLITSESMLDHSYTMINELRKHVELNAYLMAKDNTPELDKYCAKLHVKFIRRYSFKNPLNFFRELKFLIELRKENADLVWFNRTTFYMTLLIKFFFNNFIINIHDVVLHPREKDYHGIITQRLIFLFFKKHIAVMSKTQAGIFSKLYNHEPYLLRLPTIDYYKSVSLPVKEEKNPGDSKIKFFFFGSILPYKGIEYLIQACSVLAEKSRHFEVNIFGKIKYSNEELLQKISANKIINLVDRHIEYTDVASIFASNDVLVIPYIQVSQCGPLLIAYAHNVPVICSRLPGFLEYVTEGKSGLLFDNTPQSLAEKMETFISSPSLINEMKTYIKNETQSMFSMQSLTKDYISVFRKASVADL